MDEYKMYKDGFSITEINRKLGIPLSTLRFRFKTAGILRSQKEAQKIAREKGVIKSRKGIKRKPFSEEWKNNISKARLRWAEKNAKGFRINSNGYKEITRGENKGRLEHVLIMENEIGRRIFANEVVHHIDGDKTNNNIKNLRLMTNSNHCRLHSLKRMESNKKVKRNKHGKFCK
jgi:hypothetical protein